MTIDITVPGDFVRALHECARALNRYVQPDRPPRNAPGVAQQPAGNRPGDKYSADPRGQQEALEALLSAGWREIRRRGDVIFLCRPGKNPPGVSATFGHVAPGVLYVFSSSAAPFEPGRAYSPYQVFAILRHGGDFTAATRDICQRFGYETPAPNVDMSRLLEQQPTASMARQNASNAAQSAGSREDSGAVFLAVPAEDLLSAYPSLREPLVDGILRKTETMNIIAPMKRGKSWLALHLALCVATGRDWFGHICTPGRVLIIDNELHPETMAHRLPKVAEALHIDSAEYAKTLYVDNLRGRLKDIHNMAAYFEEVALAGPWALIVIDALYRFLPAGCDENSNADIAAVYNRLDEYGSLTGAAIAVIHHTSKGFQGAKSIVEVGAGASAISRAADTHLIMRPHRDPDKVVMEAVARSWPQPDGLVLQWQYPLWYAVGRASESDIAGVETASDKEIIEAIRDAGGRLPMRRIKEAVGCKYEHVQERVKVMVKAGLLRREYGERGSIIVSLKNNYETFETENEEFLDTH